MRLQGKLTHYRLLFSVLTLRLFQIALLIALYPCLEFLCCFFQFIAIQKTAAQRFKKCSSANVVSEFFISLVFRAFSHGDEKFFVKRRQTTLNAAQRQAALTSDGPVGKTKREIIKRLGFKLRQQWTLERVFECRVDHVGAVFENGRNETKEARLRIILVNEAVSGRRVDGLHYLANFVD